MRTIAVLFVLLPIGGTAALGARPSDGSLSVRDGRGMVQLSARASVIGRFDRGKLTITDPNPRDAKRPIVYGQEKTSYKSAKTVVYQGKDVRFRINGGMFHIRIEGRGIYLSAVGRGRGLIQGAENPAAGIFFDGVWSLNDEEYHSLPEELTGFQLQAAPPGA